MSECEIKAVEIALIITLSIFIIYIGKLTMKVNYLEHKLEIFHRIIKEIEEQNK